MKGEENMASEGKLKPLIKELMEEALRLRVEAFKENIDASVVANKYLDAITEIRNVCETRNRY